MENLRVIRGARGRQRSAEPPVVLKFGGRIYLVEALNVIESREWRAKMVERFFSIGSDLLSSGDQFVDVLTIRMDRCPKLITDLVFEYARSVPRDEVELIASDHEIAAAFLTILDRAFPYGQIVELIRNCAEAVLAPVRGPRMVATRASDPPAGS
jgi:hypothetical protein